MRLKKWAHVVGVNRLQSVGGWGGSFLTAAPDVIWQRCPMLFDSMMVKAQDEGVGNAD